VVELLDPVPTAGLGTNNVEALRQQVETAVLSRLGRDGQATTSEP
jgi:hypothetical protein